MPAPDCPLCPRLRHFREQNREQFPHYHNAPVPSFGSIEAACLIVGLAPGLHGANQTGRPFTNDYAGDTLYEALLWHGLAEGQYQRRGDDGLVLHDIRITNAVRCVPPQNKPLTEEIRTCNRFLASELASMPNLRVILCLGGIAHKAVLRALGYTLSAYPFGHATSYTLEDGVELLSSYHCSRYNVNTGRLTTTMFDEIIASLSARIA